MTPNLALRVRFALYAVVLAALVVVGWLAPQWATRHSVPIFATPIAGGDFELRGADGPWRLSTRAAGRAEVLLYFGFTHCPDVCPATLARIAGALGRLAPAERRRVQVVFVSVDFRRDTPAQVDEYARSFGEEFTGVTGDSAAITRVARQFEVAFAFTPLPGSALGFTVDHTGDVYVLAPGGTVLDRIGGDGGRLDPLPVIRKHLGGA